MYACTQYDAANKDVAILCNHQKGVSKAHDTQMSKLQEKKAALEAEIREGEKKSVSSLKCVLCYIRGLPASERPLPNASRRQCCRERLRKLELQIESKENLKTVSLGTSKINYLDPRLVTALAFAILSGDKSEIEVILCPG